MAQVVLSRSSGLNTRSGIGMNQMSTWWLRWPIARLSHVTHQNAVRACSFRCERHKTFQKIHQFGMPPISISGHSHHLPSRTGNRQFNAALKTPARIVANCYGITDAGQLFL